MHKKMTIDKIFLDLQYVGYHAQVPSLYFSLNNSYGEEKVISKLRSSPLYSQVSNLVLFGDTYSVQNKLEGFYDHNKTVDIVYNLSEPITYPIFQYDTFYPIVILDTITDNHLPYLETLNENYNASYIFPIKGHRFYFKKTLDFFNEWITISNIELSRVYIVPDYQLIYHSSKDITKELMRLSLKLGVRLAIPYTQQNIYF